MTQDWQERWPLYLTNQQGPRLDPPEDEDEESDSGNEREDGYDEEPDEEELQENLARCRRDREE